jgi:hypothetical protein
MSSSYSEQEFPPRRRPEDDDLGPRERRREFDDDDERERPQRLGSLAQKARGQQLKTARTILFVLGGLAIVWNGIDLAMLPSAVKEGIRKEIAKQQQFGRVIVDQKEVDRVEKMAIMTGSVLDGMFILMGVIFVVLGFIVYRFPVPVTISALVLYILATVVMVAVLLLTMPDALPAMGAGLVVRIVYIVVLARAIQAAVAYEKEQRASRAFATDY